MMRVLSSLVPVVLLASNSALAESVGASMSDAARAACITEIKTYDAVVQTFPEAERTPAQEKTLADLRRNVDNCAKSAGGKVDDAEPSGQYDLSQFSEVEKKVCRKPIESFTSTQNIGNGDGLRRPSKEWLADAATNDWGDVMRCINEYRHEAQGKQDRERWWNEASRRAGPRATEVMLTRFRGRFSA